MICVCGGFALPLPVKERLADPGIALSRAAAHLFLSASHITIISQILAFMTDYCPKSPMTLK